MSQRGGRIRIGTARMSVPVRRAVRPWRTGRFVAAVTGTGALVLLAIVGIVFAIKPRLMDRTHWSNAVLVPAVMMTNHEVLPSVPTPPIPRKPTLANTPKEKAVPELLSVFPRQLPIIRRMLEPTLDSPEPWGSFEIDRETRRITSISNLPETQGNGENAE